MKTDEATRLTESRQVTAVEWLALVSLTVVTIVVSGLPYTYGYLSAPPGRVFMGIAFNVPDTSQYFAWAYESAKALFIENKLTPERGDPVFFNLFWIVVGHIATALNVGIPEAHLFVRPVAGVAYVGSIFWFCWLFTRDWIERWTAFAVVAVGGGLGWLLVVVKQITGSLPYPLDVYLVEPNTFFTVMVSPLQSMSGSLLVLSIAVGAIALERDSLGLSVVAGLLALLLGVTHGYDLLIVYLVLGGAAAYLAFESGKLRLRPLVLAAATFIWSAPAALYLFLLTRISPIWRGVLAQYGNAGVYTPPPAHLLILFGVPILLVLATRRAPEPARVSGRELVLRSWLVLGFPLLYLPTDFQIKMLAGWQLPVGLIATRIALDWIVPRLRLPAMPRLTGIDRGRLIVSAAMVVSVLPVNVYLLGWRIGELARHDYPFYLARDDVSALEWIHQNASPEDVVLSSLTIGEYVPSVAGTRAFLAHWAQTLEYYKKLDQVSAFFDASNTDEERAALLRQFGVKYIVYGRPERDLGRYDPSTSSLFSRVFTSPETDVYAVRSDTGTARGEP